MTLGQKQRLFSSLFAKLILWAYACGYEITFGETYRSDEQAEINALGPEGRETLIHWLEIGPKELKGLAETLKNNVGSGIRGTLHELRLASDINLFMNGAYLMASESYRPLGEKWKSFDPQCRWGGDFPKPDGNHFSIAHEGKA